jgi:hypothetical protein
LLDRRGLWRVVAVVLLCVAVFSAYGTLRPRGSVPVAHLVDGPSRDGDHAIAPPPDHFDGPAAPAAPPPAALRSPFSHLAAGPGTWAVTIGIDDYPGTHHDLRSARADADDVDRALLREGVSGDHIVSIRDRQATAAVVRLAAQWLVARSAPDSVAIFFYAGHARRLGPSAQAVVAADGNVVRDRELATLLAPLQARQAWIGMASCYGGGFDELLAPGRVLTGAAPANSLAYENEGFGRSYMVQYMIREAMLEGLAPGSVQDAFAYAHARIGEQFSGRQPVQIDDGPGPLRFRPPVPVAARADAGSTTPTTLAGPDPIGEPGYDPSGGGGDGSGDSGGSGGGRSSPAPTPAPCVPTVIARVCR